MTKASVDRGDNRVKLHADLASTHGFSLTTAGNNSSTL
jgi:hypothetical protein